MKKPHAFTLVEILVSLAVLSIIGYVIVQTVSSVSRTTRLGDRTIDAVSQARLAFGRIDLDLKNRINRRDAVFDARNGPGNLMLFLSGVPAPEWNSNANGGNRGISMVAYRIDAHADNDNRLGLLRGSVPIGWHDLNFMGLKPNGLPLLVTDADFNPALLPRRPPDSGHDDFDVLAPGVIRMLLGFQLYPDHAEVRLLNGATVTGLGQVVYSPPIRDGVDAADVVDPGRIAAIVVAVATLDLNTVKTLPPQHLNTLAAVFAIPADGGDLLPVQQWMTDTNDLSNLPAPVPAPARQAVRLYQRFYLITPYGDGNE